LDEFERAIQLDLAHFAKEPRFVFVGQRHVTVQVEHDDIADGPGSDFGPVHRQPRL
jgi:hypothetical protein